MTSVLVSPLISFTPHIQSSNHNLVRICRTHNISDNVRLVAGGPYQGIIINRLTTEYEPLENFLLWRFSVWINDCQTLRQEIRSFRFCFYPEVSSPTIQSEVSQQFIKNLFTSFPKDYASFFKLILQLMQADFFELKAIDVEMKFAAEGETIPQPDAKEYENDAEIENVTIGHIQDVLEHAFPNGLPVEMIADSLRCSEEEVEAYLIELERLGVTAKIPNQNQWIRVDNFSVPESSYQVQNKQHPTVAIITCLFVEKQSIDAIIDGSSTLHKYSKAGDSNVYTIGFIGEHRVVATKLAMIGDSREATTSAGSITTRLLGSFPHIDHVIIVGVGGGVPHFTDPNRHVRLGDVVISDIINGESNNTIISNGTGGRKDSTYVYAHNFVVSRKTEQVEGFATHDWRPKNNVLADVVRNRDKVLINEWQTTANELIDKLNVTAKSNEYDFSRPPNESDVLTVQIGPDNVVVFPHPNEERVTPEIHLGPIGAMVSLRRPVLPKPLPKPTLHNTQKENKNVLKNGATENNETNNGTTTETEASWLQRTAQLRDKFVAENHVKAIDAGFDSVIAAVTGSRIDSWVLVRGIADYQQGSTRLGKLWQAYASVNAASLVKAILRRVPAN